MQRLSEKDPISDFPVFPGSTEALFRENKTRLMTYFLNNISAKIIKIGSRLSNL